MRLVNKIEVVKCIKITMLNDEEIFLDGKDLDQMRNCLSEIGAHEQ